MAQYFLDSSSTNISTSICFAKIFFITVSLLIRFKYRRILNLHANFALWITIFLQLSSQMSFYKFISKVNQTEAAFLLRSHLLFQNFQASPCQVCKCAFDYNWTKIQRFCGTHYTRELCGSSLVILMVLMACPDFFKDEKVVQSNHSVSYLNSNLIQN